MKFPFKRSQVLVLGLLLVVTALAVGFWGCSNTSDNPASPQEELQTSFFSVRNPEIQSVMAVQNRHTAKLMADPEVIGTATSLTDDGKPAVMVLVTTEKAARGVPAKLDGVPVKILRTDPIRAFRPVKPVPGDDPKARLERPIQLGCSGGNAHDLANGYCCSGTLGSLITKSGKFYILSNSHVFAGDFASSPGDPDVAEIGDPINQPGLIEVGCQDISADYVATLSSLSTLNTSLNIDAAIAEIITGQVRTDGSILGIGTLSSATMDAYIGLDVKKSGRTTGLTREDVTGLNATITVGYEDECAGTYFTKVFTGQILVGQRASKFLNSGDSGSLMVEDVDTNPRAVGLLFAGSSRTAIANPIDDVLSHFGATMVGQ
jgi:hypothetical protein